MIHCGICGICDSSCGLAVEHDGTRILKVRGDAQDAFSRGHDREGIRLATAARRPGASMNDITDDCLVVGISGASALNGVPVRVSAG